MKLEHHQDVTVRFEHPITGKLTRYRGYLEWVEEEMRFLIMIPEYGISFPADMFSELKVHKKRKRKTK